MSVKSSDSAWFEVSCLSGFLSVHQAVLRRRDAIQVEYEMTLEELNRKKDEKEQVH